LPEIVAVATCSLFIVARKEHVRLVNLYKSLSNHREWFHDEIHPNKAGSAEIARVIAIKLKKWKKRIESR